MTVIDGVEIPSHLDDGRFEDCPAKLIRLWIKFDKMSEGELVEYSKNNPSTGVSLTEDDIGFHTVDNEGLEGEVCRDKNGKIYFHRWVDELEEAGN